MPPRQRQAIILNAKSVQGLDVVATIATKLDKAVHDMLLVMTLLNFTADDLLSILKEQLYKLNHPQNYIDYTRRSRFDKKYMAFSSFLPDFQHTHFDGQYYYLNPLTENDANQLQIAYETQNPVLVTDNPMLVTESA